MIGRRSIDDPLHAELVRGIDGDFRDNSLDVYLSTWYVQLLDDRAQRFEDRHGRRDDQRIRHFIRLDIDGGTVNATSTGILGLRLNYITADRAQDLGQVYRFSITQIDHVNITRRLHRLIKLCNYGPIFKTFFFVSAEQDTVSTLIGTEFHIGYRSFFLCWIVGAQGG